MSRAAGLMVVLLAATAASADEAVPREGKRQPGALVLDEQGRLFFHPSDRSPPVPLASLREVRFTPSPAPLRPAVAFHVVLPGEQTLTGELERYAEGKLHLRTASGTVTIPREAILSIGPRPGWSIVVVDDFGQGLKEWTVTGKPALHDHGVILASGDGLTRSFSQPLTNARLGLNFKVHERLQNARGEIRVLLSDGKDRQTLTVTLEENTIIAQGIKGTSHKIALGGGWQRLEVEIGPAGLRALIDSEVLWQASEPPGKHGLAGLELHCLPQKKEKAGGSVLFAAFGMERATPSQRRPQGDSTQDELWLSSGDQLFGKLQGVDLHRVTLTRGSRERALPWSELRGVFPAQATLKTTALTGEHVRVELENTVQPRADRLVGVVTALDGKTLKLKTSLLGELSLPRAAVRSIEGLGHGKREYPSLPPP